METGVAGACAGIAVWSLSAAAIVGLSACGGEEAPAEILRPVRTEQVFSTGAARVRSFSGIARAGRESRLSFRVAGSVQRVAVDVGDSVETGALLAQLDPEDYRLLVQEAEAAQAQAQAQARNAESNFERVRALYEANNASPSDFEAARAARESADASVRAAEQRLELARQQLAYTRLTAPAAGAVASVQVETNENVSPGQPVVLLTSGSGIEVEVAVPEVLIARIQQGDAASVTFDAVPGRTFEGTVTEVGVAAVGAATTYPVTVTLPPTDADIRSGMAAEVSFAFEATEGVQRTLVSSVAVLEDPDGTFVYVVEPAEGEPGVGIVSRRPVVAGELTPDGMEILEGLEDGEHVVIAGVSRIEDGLRVRFGKE